MEDVRAIANLVIRSAQQSGSNVTNMHINKILYFIWGEYFAEYEKELFCETFEAWQHGPVISEIYHQFKVFGDSPITSYAVSTDFHSGKKIVVEDDLPPDERSFLQSRIELYVRISAYQLREWSHVEGGPWWCCWEHNGKTNPGMEIDSKEIMRYFKELWPYGASLGTA